MCKSWRVAAARARVRFVGGSGRGAYSTPLAAISAAQPFDEVRFSAGEHVVPTDLVVSLPLTLVGVRGATLVLRRGATLRIDHPEGRMRSLAFRRSSWERPAAFWRARQRAASTDGSGSESATASNAVRWGSRARDEYDQRVPLLEISPQQRWSSMPFPAGDASVGVMASSACWRIEGCSFDGSVALQRPGYSGGGYDAQIERHPCIVLSGLARARVLSCAVRSASVGLLVRGEAPCAEVVGSAFAGCMCGVEIDVGGGSANPCSVIQRCTFNGTLEYAPRTSLRATEDDAEAMGGVGASAAASGVNKVVSTDGGTDGGVGEEGSVGLLIYGGCVAAVENKIVGFDVGAAICGGVEELKARDPGAAARELELFPAILGPGGAAGGARGGGGPRALGAVLRDLRGVERLLLSATTAKTHVQRSTPFDVGFFRNDVAWCAQAAVVVQGGATPKLKLNTIHDSRVGVLIRGEGRGSGGDHSGGAARAQAPQAPASRERVPSRAYLKSNCV